jgi:DNA-binding transcriptional ArsR family regulator
VSAARDGGGSGIPEVDRLIHEPARYSIMALLYVVSRAEFLFILNQTEMTPGNLSSHLSKLGAAGYLTIEKQFVGKLPKTFLSLTGRGRKAFTHYRDSMRKLFNKPPPTPRGVDNC